MANRKQKMRVLNKLLDTGYVTEKGIESLSTASIIKIPGLSFADIGIIVRLQEAVRSHKLIAYLGEEDEEDE